MPNVTDQRANAPLFAALLLSALACGDDDPGAFVPTPDVFDSADADGADVPPDGDAGDTRDDANDADGSDILDSGDITDASDAADGGDVEPAPGITIPPGQPHGTDEVLPGAGIYGIAFETPTGLVVVDDSVNAPADGTAVADLPVRLFDMHGDERAATITDANGRFTFDEAPRGFLTAEIGADDSTVTVPITSVAEGEVPLGRPYAVDRDTAVATATDALPLTAFAAASMQPLLAGTVIAPRGEDPEDSPSSTTLEADAWLVFVDMEPGFRFAHAARYVVVDADSGEATAFDIEERLRVNRGLLWNDDRDLFVYVGVDFDELGAVIPTNIETQATPEVVLLPTERGGADPDTKSAGTSTPKNDITVPLGGDAIFPIFFEAGADSVSMMDMIYMYWFFTNRGGVPNGQSAIIQPTVQGIRNTENYYRTELQRVNAAMQERLDANLPSTLVLYMTGHGPKKDGVPTGEIVVEYPNDREHYWTTARFNPGNELVNTPACRVRIIIDTCFAGLLAEQFAEMFAALPDDERPDLQIVASSRGDQKSLGAPLWLTAVTAGLVDPGSAFTERISDNGGFADGDLTGLVTPEGEIDDDIDPFGQTPVAIVEPNVPTRCVGLIYCETSCCGECGDGQVCDGATCDCVDDRVCDVGSVLINPTGGRADVSEDGYLAYVDGATSEFGTRTVTVVDLCGSETWTAEIPGSGFVSGTPQIADGLVVWADDRDSRNAHRLFEWPFLDGGEPTLLLGGDSVRSNPRLGSPIVAWLDDADDGRTIMAMDLSDRTPIVVSDAPLAAFVDVRFATSEGRVVWLDADENLHIAVAPDFEDTTLELSRPLAVTIGLALDGDALVFDDFDGDSGQFEIFAADLDTGLVTPIPTGDGPRTRPDISADRIVFEQVHGPFGPDQSISLFDPTSAAGVESLSDADPPMRNPRVTGRFVVWERGLGGVFATVLPEP